jgi:hypothetical protein
MKTLRRNEQEKGRKGDRGRRKWWGEPNGGSAGRKGRRWKKREKVEVERARRAEVM